jgi:hypothetical protein
MPVFAISYFLGYSHSNLGKVISHCGFDLHFPDVS